MLQVAKIIIAVVACGSLLSFTPNVLAISCTGCVDLDELNFNQTVNRFTYSLVKFDIAFPYGEKHEAFADFSKAAHKVTDELLVATVGIKDYGEMENKELGLRYQVDDKSFPGILLFQGSIDKFVRFPAHLEVTLDNLKSFVTSNSNLYIGRDGCLKEFNQLVKGFANQESAEQLKLLARGENMAQELTKDEEKASAKSYIIFMRKINERGYNFVEVEMKRLLRLRAGKVSDAKKVELTRKLNILESFRVGKLKRQPSDTANDVVEGEEEAEEAAKGEL